MEGGELTSGKMIELWQRWVSGKATDTALNTRAQVRTFLAWLKNKDWLKGKDVLDGVEVLGKRRKGKPKLTYDEAKKLVTWCLARPTDAGAVATLAAYWLGVRATELTSSTVRDLDAGATLLDITDAKTEAGDRTLRLPCKLQPLVKALADGKQPGDFLFGDVDRHWLLRQVRRCCEGAGVPVVSPHGLRGSHAKHAREVGVSGVQLAQAMGHESETTTTDHYAGRGAVANAGIDRVTRLVH